MATISCYKAALSLRLYFPEGGREGAPDITGVAALCCSLLLPCLGFHFSWGRNFGKWSHFILEKVKTFGSTSNTGFNNKVFRNLLIFFPPGSQGSRASGHTAGQFFGQVLLRRSQWSAWPVGWPKVLQVVFRYRLTKYTHTSSFNSARKFEAATFSQLGLHEGSHTLPQGICTYL